MSRHINQDVSIIAAQLYKYLSRKKQSESIIRIKSDHLYKVQPIAINTIVTNILRLSLASQPAFEHFATHGDEDEPDFFYYSSCSRLESDCVVNDRRHHDFAISTPSFIESSVSDGYNNSSIYCNINGEKERLSKDFYNVSMIVSTSYL